MNEFERLIKAFDKEVKEKHIKKKTEKAVEKKKLTHTQKMANVSLGQRVRSDLINGLDYKFSHVLRGVAGHGKISKQLKEKVKRCRGAVHQIISE